MTTQLGAGHLGEVLEHLDADRLGQHRVVRAAGHQPGLGRGGQRRLAASRPRRPRAAAGRASSGSTTSITLAVSRKRSPRSEIPHTTAGPGSAVNRRRTGSSRSPMPSGWISSDGCVGGDARADLEHVRAEDLLLARDQVVGVVLHERRPAGQPGRHHLGRPQQHRGLPVALAAEAVAVGHQPLHRQARELAQAAEVLEVGGERPEATLGQEGAQPELDPRAVAQRLVPVAARQQLGRDAGRCRRTP